MARTFVNLLAVAVAIGVADAALAVDSTSNEGLEEVVVTSQLRKENLKDVPMAISAVSGETLAQEHLTSIADLANRVPNLDVAPLGLGQQIIAIRGVSGERGSSSLTGIYLNNVPVSGLQDGFLATYPDVGMYDLQRVEVLKGPQGTLFGEGAVGGVVRFMANTPELTKYSGLASATGFYTDAGRVSGDVTLVGNVPVIPDTLAVRLAGNVENYSGWINQPSIGRKHINNQRVQDGRIQALWTPITDLSISALVALHRGVADASDIVNVGSPEDSNFTQGYYPYLHAPTDSWDKYIISNLSVTYHMAFADFLSSTSQITRSSMQNSTQVWPADTQVDTVDLEGFTQRNTTTSQEFRLTSVGDGPFKWVAGAMYKDTKLTDSLGDQLVSLFNGGVVLEIPPGPPTINESKSAAGYADVSYKIIPSFEVGGGIRYAHDDRSAYEPGVDGSLETATFSVTTYRYFASYTITDGVKAYGSVGTGFRSGGFNFIDQVAQGAPPSYGPEHDKSYELGLKSAFFDRRLSFDTALFYNAYQDMQDTVVSRNAAGVTIQYTANQQSALARGVEWSTDWRATPDLTLHLSGDVLHSVITEASPVASYRVGDPINYVPKYSLQLGADYKLNGLANLPLVVHVDFNRKGRSFDTLNGLQENYGTPTQVSVHPVNFLNMSVAAVHDSWTFTAFGRNLLDERGWIRPGSSGWQSQARPLNVGITIAKDF